MSGEAFRYVRAADIDDAIASGAEAKTAFLAGGTDLLQLWKAGVVGPRVVIDISRLPLASVDVSGDDLCLGALACLSDVANNLEVAARYPMIRAAILASASGQIRNMASVGGNLLQRTRCAYFRHEALPCNKRSPGSGCGAANGEHRAAALFGASASCIATHPSDLAVALIALNAAVDIHGVTGARRIPLCDLYRLPGEAPERDTNLAPGDLITHIRVDNAARLAPRSTYLKVRDRASFEFAVVSVAAALIVQDGLIREARLAAGGVAPVPWRLGRCEAALLGKAPDSAAFEAAAALAMQGAQALTQNAFKVKLLQRAIVRALETVGGKT
jgi:xanthine dehydrogenase YagS FAD-binding subunit